MSGIGSVPPAPGEDSAGAATYARHMTTAPRPTTCVLGRLAGGRIALCEISGGGEPGPRQEFDQEQLAQVVARREAEGRPRWVWSDTATWYPGLLGAGVRVERCHDLRLVHTILQRAAAVTDGAALRAATAWETGPVVPAEGRPPAATLFDVAPAAGSAVPHDLEETLAEHARQQAAIASAADPSPLRLLAAAESAGGLVAAELLAAGMPWDVVEHDRILAEQLGPRPGHGQPPARMVEVGAQVRTALGDPMLSLDSPPRVLKALRRAGIDVSSTSQWELAEHDHPAIEPLLRYKKLSRLLTANGWAWIDEWVHEGRYRPVYLPGGVVTGRWASNGGGALQIPRQLRPALRADTGWMLVGADVSQLEPRVLAAMAGDRAMADAGRGKDLYSGIVEAGVVATRAEAKVAVLGALYGSTTGDAGRLVPRLRRTFPRAMALVDEAAATGERGGTVHTWLGRTSPPPGPEWAAVQTRGGVVDATTADEERARRAGRDRGRFTRNFVVQGTAAEWALAWLADLRLRLSRIAPVPEEHAATASGPALGNRPHLAFFLHDEVIVHAPREHAEEAAQAVRDAADSAGRLLFPGSPVDFPLDLTITERSAK